VGTSVQLKKNHREINFSVIFEILFVMILAPSGT